MAENIRCWVWLSSLPQIGAVKGKKLLEYFGGPRGVWEADELDLRGLDYLTYANIKVLKDKKLKEQSEVHFESIYRHSIRITTIFDSSYPESLKNIYDPPIVIYTKGKLVSNEKMLAVVGSRKATQYGLNVAEVLSAELACRGITVVSGMAKGVDSYAHRGALKAKGRTLAVLGCGLDTAYPKENKELMNEICEKGAVLSEYLPGVRPWPQNFPARNRIISGLSLGVIVIEASDNSGSLITADFALEQGREVFAVPGNLDSENSRGTNRLIKDGAKMVTNIGDILEELNIPSCTEDIFSKKIQKPSILNTFTDLEDEEVRIVRCIEEEPLNIDTIAEKCGLAVKTVNSTVTMLELKGMIRQMPGKIILLVKN